MAAPVFKVGDRVRYKGTNASGTVIIGPKTSRGKNYTVAFDEGTMLHGIRYGRESDLFNPEMEKQQLGPQVIVLERLEPAKEESTLSKDLMKK